MTIESNRTLGGVAAILFLVGIVSQISSALGYIFPRSIGALIFSGISGVFSVLSFVGLILFLVAMHGFSKDYNEPKIFNYLLYGIIITIIAAVIFVAIAIIVILFSFAALFPSISSSTTATPQISSAMSRVFAYIVPIAGLIGVIWIAFNVKAFNLLSDKSKVPLFRTGAKVLLVGALVNIVIAIIFAIVAAYSSITLNTLLALLTLGSLVQDVAWVLLAMGYFRIQAPPQQTISPQPPLQVAAPVNVPPSGQVKFCTYCGAPNQPDAVYCTRCGQKL